MNISVNEEQRLLITYPLGVFDMKLAEEIVHFIEVWEVKHQEGYDRFCDVTRLDAIHLSPPQKSSRSLCAEDSLMRIQFM